MTQELTMPKLSDSMADAVIVRWLKSEGDAFSRGEALIEVETDKATVVYEAEVDGKLGAILAPEGANVAVGEPIATLANGSSPDPRTAGGSHRCRWGRGRASERDAGRPTDCGGARRLPARHRRHRARAAASRARTSGARRNQAMSNTQAASAGKGDVRVIELTATQATIARRMVESATTIPVFTVTADVDMSLIAALRKGAREEGGDVASLNDFVVKAAALTLREFPRFNASYADGKLECYSRINVGIAVATDDALLVPVVADADRKSLAEIAAVSRRLAEAARHRALQPGRAPRRRRSRSRTSACSASDPSRRSSIRRRSPSSPSADPRRRRDDGQTLSCDHRVVYGADGARFLSRLRELLERPLVLADSSGERPLPHRDPRCARRGARSRRARGSLRRGRRRGGRSLRDDDRPLRQVRARPRLRHADLGAPRSRVRRSARPSPACGRSWRSCSATSSRSRWTASSTSRRSTGS